MSRIADLGKDNSNLLNILTEYDDALEQARTILPIANKTLELAQKEQCSWYVYYDERRAELKTLVKHMTSQVDRVRGTLTRQYTERPSKDLGERLISKYIDAEPSYLSIYGVQLELEELYDKYSAVVEAFTKRGYALKDLTAARVAEVSNTPI